MKKKTKKTIKYTLITIVIIIVLFLIFSYFFGICGFYNDKSSCETNPLCFWKITGGGGGFDEKGEWVVGVKYDCCLKLPCKLKFIKSTGKYECVDYIPFWMFWYPLRCRMILYS